MATNSLGKHPHTASNTFGDGNRNNRRREHNSPNCCEVKGINGKLETFARKEPYCVMKGHKTQSTSKVEPFSAAVNICNNEMFTPSNSKMDIWTRNIRSDCEKPFRGKTDNAQTCVIIKVESKASDGTKSDYFRKEDLLVRNITNECDKTAHSSKLACATSATTSTGNERKDCKYVPNLKTHHSSSRANNLYLHTSISNSHNSKLGLQTGNLRVQTSNSSLKSDISDNSYLQTGSNWTLSQPCKHSLSPLNKKTVSEDGLSCRICHSVTDLDTLVSPCLCTGSMKYVHESCLLNWLKSSVKTNCELCLHEVPVKKVIKPLREWRFLDEKPVAIIWLLSFLILLTLNILSVIKDASRGCTSTTCIVFYVLGCTGAVLGVIFLWFWARKSAVYFKKLLILNQIWLLDEENYKSKRRTSVVNSNV